MAFRDARRRIKPMLLAMSCVVLGVAAIVASFSFRDNLQTSVSARAKSLLGADLAIQSREPFSPEAEDLLKKLNPEDGSKPQNLDETEREIGILLYRVKLGMPRSEGLLRILEDPENLRRMNRAEMELHADQSKKQLRD